MEILHPDNKPLSDLRRAYIDKDLSSIFRLMEGDICGDLDDLRSAVLDQNLYGIFRLVTGSDELRKFVMEDNIWKMWSLLQQHTDTNFVKALKDLYINDITFNKDSLAQGQINSKLFLVNELKRLDLDLGMVFLCAGWYGTLATMLFESGLNIDKIRSFDIDPSVAEISEIFNKPWRLDNWRFKGITEDIMNINYSGHTWSAWSESNNRQSRLTTEIPDTVINTSCEHIPEFAKWYAKIPDGTLVVLQSNNYFEVEEHVNCYSTLEEFGESAPMTASYSLKALSLDKYDRYMKIGIK
jgi:hypothetical protein